MVRCIETVAKDEDGNFISNRDRKYDSYLVDDENLHRLLTHAGRAATVTLDGESGNWLVTIVFDETDILDEQGLMEKYYAYSWTDDTMASISPL